MVTISIDVSDVYGKRGQSPPAQAIAVLMMYLGVIFMSMPIAIVGTCFSQAWHDKDRIVLVEKVRSRMRQQVLRLPPRGVWLGEIENFDFSV